jgi:hypothetical protein
MVWERLDPLDLEPLQDGLTVGIAWTSVSGISTIGADPDGMIAVAVAEMKSQSKALVRAGEPAVVKLSLDRLTRSGMAAAPVRRAAGMD